jgi:hypothetical protein
VEKKIKEMLSRGGAIQQAREQLFHRNLRTHVPGVKDESSDATEIPHKTKESQCKEPSTRLPAPMCNLGTLNLSERSNISRKRKLQSSSSLGFSYLRVFSLFVCLWDILYFQQFVFNNSAKQQRRAPVRCAHQVSCYGCLAGKNRLKILFYLDFMSIFIFHNECFPPIYPFRLLQIPRMQMSFSSQRAAKGGTRRNDRYIVEKWCVMKRC